MTDMAGATQALGRNEAAAIAHAFQPSRRNGNRWHYYYSRSKLCSDP